MTRTKLAVVILLAALSPAAPGVAQQVDEQEVPPPETSTGVEASPATNEDAQAPTASADSPYDYRASEEISEDLSVSFPVDI